MIAARLFGLSPRASAPNSSARRRICPVREKLRPAPCGEKPRPLAAFSNDADRLVKYLARFDLKFDEIRMR
jgi:hypothetical protein